MIVAELDDGVHRLRVIVSDVSVREVPALTDETRGRREHRHRRDRRRRHRLRRSNAVRLAPGRAEVPNQMGSGSCPGTTRMLNHLTWS